ncbi:hypothetical protein SAZ11_41695 [Streptomyces sp. FXJ1.4098]|uniref:hypothetical protein n=1 Tax=Streptomyces sp. NPDC020845 TaxID=3365096 RepID=UPI0029951D3F|nr:hypothetical protein [Streptomyces sp. FXJ1.4098]
MEQQQATANLSESPTLIDVEQAEAAIVEHYPRLVRLAYLVLPPGVGRTRRVLAAHALAQRALPRNRANSAGTQTSTGPGLPGQRGSQGGPEGAAGDGGYAFVRLRVLRGALRAARRRRGPLAPALPRVWGLRLVPRPGGADELALDKALSELSGPGRAAYVLRELEEMDDPEVREVLKAAGVVDPRGALIEADEMDGPAGSRDGALLESAEFDACSLQARPTDLMRRRQHVRAALAAAAALVVCGTLLGLPGEGWGPSGAAAPSYARNPSSERALDPAQLTRAEPGAWRTATRADFSSWPARGDRTDDTPLLRRALAVWARPGRSVHVSATPGTQSGPPSGPPQLLYAGEVDQVTVVLLYDGLRVVRYAEKGRGDGGAVALDFARTDAADAASSTALVATRADGNVRYLTAPWVRRPSVRDLVRPDEAPRPLRLAPDGVTDPVRAGGAGLMPGSGRTPECESWTALRLGSRLVTDLGEIVPARLTYGAPGGFGPGGGPLDVAGAEARAAWAHTGCRLPLLHSRGVREVNAWRFAAQRLPEGGGAADWVCTRAETWRGVGDRVLAQFQPPARDPGAPAAIVASADGSPDCGPRAPRVLAGALWKSRTGRWYLLAAGSSQVTAVAARGDVRGAAAGRLLTLPAEAGDQARLIGRLMGGGRLTALR